MLVQRSQLSQHMQLPPCNCVCVCVFPCVVCLCMLQAVVIAAALSMSSSAFVLQLLAERGESATRTGSATLGILLFQVRTKAVGQVLYAQLFCAVPRCAELPLCCSVL